MNSHGFFCPLGVAALALALLLPTAANAQTPAAPVISIADGDGGTDVQVELDSGLDVKTSNFGRLITSMPVATQRQPLPPLSTNECALLASALTVRGPGKPCIAAAKLR